MDWRLTRQSAGYPQKGIPKNFVSLITYPHSEIKRLENRPFTKAT